jgi:hypothetical protein
MYGVLVGEEEKLTQKIEIFSSVPPANVHVRLRVCM